MDRSTSTARRLALSFVLATPVGGAAAELSGNAALTSDYVWRGTSQSDERPAVQAGFKLAGASGAYAQVWGSSVTFGPEVRASSELDFVVGWSGVLSEALVLDAGVTHYRYPGTTVDLDWTEAGATLTWRSRAWLQVAHARDALASGAHGTYAQVGVRMPLGDRLRLEAAVGRYRLGAGYDDYTHLQLGAVWTVAAPLELRLTVHDTGTSATRSFGPWAGSRVEAALQASF